jgi:hypothetical protein
MGYGMELHNAGRLHIALLLCGFFLLFSGCIENRHTYKFNRDGSCNLTCQIRGDSADIYHPPGSYPESPTFQIKTSVEYDSAGKPTHVLEAAATFARDSLPAYFGSMRGAQAEFLVHHPVKLSMIRLFFLTIYKYEQVFEGRRRTATEGDRWKFIPAECKVLENGGDSLLSAAERSRLEEQYAAGMLLWNSARYNLRFQEIIKRLSESEARISLSSTLREELLQRLDTLVNDHSRLEQALSPTNNLDMVDLEWWTDLSPQANVLLEQYLNPNADPRMQAQLLDVENLLEFRHSMDEDVADESFTIRVDLPGRIMRSNTKIMEKGVLVWKILGQDLEEENAMLQASSLYLHPTNIVITISLLIILIIVLRTRGVRLHKRNMIGPPPPRK